MMNTYPHGSSNPNVRLLSEARAELGSISRQAKEADQVFVMRRHGRDESVLISKERYEMLEQARLELERIKSEAALSQADDDIRQQLLRRDITHADFLTQGPRESE